MVKDVLMIASLKVASNRHIPCKLANREEPIFQFLKTRRDVYMLIL